MSGPSSHDPGDYRFVRAGPRLPASVVLLVTGLLIVGIVGGLAAWLSHGDVPADEPTSGSTTATVPVAPVARDVGGSPAATLPVAADAAAVESLAPPLDDHSIRGNSRVLAQWGSPFEGGARASCTLVVIDWEDRPVPGAVVHLWGDEGKTESKGDEAALAPHSIGPFDWTTGPDGRCTVQPPEFRPRFQAEKAGVGSSRWVELSVGRESQYREVLVPLVPDARVVGRVISADGRPVAGATILVEVGRAMAPAEKIDAQPDGTFEVAVTPFEPVGVSLHIPDIKTRGHRLTLKPGETRELVLRQPGRFAIRGVVVDRWRRPYSSHPPTWVYFWPDTERLADAEGFPSAGRPRLPVRIADEGRFEFLLDRPVRGMLTAQGSFPGLVATPHVAVDVQQPSVDVELRAVEPARISGRVLGEGGSPLVGVEVHVAPDSKPWTSIDMTRGVRESDLYADWRQKTSDDGEFLFLDLHPEARYTITVRDERGRAPLLSVRGVVPGTEGLVLAPGTQAARTGSIVLAVTAGDTGERAGEYELTLWERASGGGWLDKRSHLSETTSGLAIVDRLTAGVAYDLLVKAEGLACACAAGVVATEEGTALKLMLPALARLSIDVRHAGRPAGWPVVVASRAQGPGELLFHGHGTRGARGTALGRVELIDLEPGRYTLLVTQGGRRATEQLDLAHGELRSMSIDLK